MKKLLIAVLALVSVVVATLTVTKTAGPIRGQNAEAGEPFRAKRNTVPHEPSPVDDEQGVTPIYNPVPSGPMSPYSPSGFTNLNFDQLVEEAHRRLSEYLQALKRNKAALNPAQVELQQALEKYMRHAQLDEITSALKAIVEESPGTDEAKRAAAAIESLKKPATPQKEAQPNSDQPRAKPAN